MTIPRFKDVSNLAADRLRDFGRRQRKTVNAPWIIRQFRALKWKYESNDAFRLVVDSVLMFCSLGVTIAFICLCSYIYGLTQTP